MNISSNIRKLTNLFILLFVLMSAGIVYWQVIVAQPVSANVHNSRHCMADSSPKRGRILDRNGVVLAESKPVQAHPPCSPYERFYTDPSLAGLIGTYISPFYGINGIEKQYNNYLNGEVGSTQFNNNANKVLHRPPVGDDIYLTIDSRIQKIANEAFDTEILIDNVHSFQSDRGSIIVTDPKTGEVLAMVSRPNYDPNKYVQDVISNPGTMPYVKSLQTSPEAPTLFRPLRGHYVPGSVYKSVTLLAGLDSGTSHLEDQYNNDAPGTTDWQTKPQAIKVRIGNATFGPEGNNLNGGAEHPMPVSLMDGFAHSDNIILAQVGAKAGKETWLDYNKRFYVGDTIPFDLPVEKSTVTHANGDLSDAELAADSFGQGVNLVTPFQMTLFDNAIANNGSLMRPTLVSKIMDPNGTAVMSHAPEELSKPIKQETASQVRDAMYGVAQCGSGRFSFTGTTPPLLNTSQYQIIAKTGTGELGGDQAAQSWMLSQAPYQDPKLTIVAMRENGGEGGSSVGPMVHVMYDRIFSEVYKMAPPAPPAVGSGDQYCTAHNLN